MPSLKNHKFDKEKEIEGVWFVSSDGLRLKIARFNNPNAIRMTRKLALANSRALKRDKEGDLLSELAIKVHAKHILVDWKDVLEDDEVTPMPYSSKKAEELLIEFPTFLEEVLEFSLREDEFRIELVEAAVKNS